MESLLSSPARCWASRGAIVAALSLFAAAAAAQGSAGVTVRTTVEGEPLETPFSGPQVEEGALPLSLEQAVEIALERNLGLLVERYDLRQAELSLFGNRAIYDLRLSATGLATDSTPATVDRTQAGTRRTDFLTAGLSQLTLLGGDLSVSADASQTTSDNEFIQAATFFNANLDLQFVQPLLQNFGRLATERGLRLARLDRRLSSEEFERQVNLTLQQVENAYWSVIDAREQLRVAEQARDLAVELHERNQIEVEVGTRAPLELVQSEAQIATREEEIIRAQAAVGDAEDRLRQLLNLPVDLWDLPLTLTTEPASDPIEIDLQQAIATAYAQRPEMRSQQLVLDRVEVDAAYFRNQQRPRLDLNLSYTLGGVADDDIGQNLGDAFSDVFGRDFDGWTVRMDFAYPLQNRAASANRASADVAVEQEKARFEDLRKQILTEVRTAVRGVTSAIQQIRAARVARQLQERNLEAEQKRYENGMSTSFEVTRIQDDLTQARSREVTAVTNYRTALAEYYRSVGRLLDQYDIEIVGGEEDGGGV